MNVKDISEALGDVNPRFVAEALTYRRKNMPLWFPIATAAACLCLLVGLLVPEPGSLGYAPTMGYVPTGPADGYGNSYFRGGVPIQGLVIGGDYDSVTVQDLQITLDLNGSPVDSGTAVSKTAMEYTFHNPTDKAITLTLTLPCGQDPWYETDTDWFDINRHLYTASVNGEPLDPTLRLTGGDIPPAGDAPWHIGVFANDTPVTAFTYEIQALESGDSVFASVWQSGMDKSVVMLECDWSNMIISASTTQDFSVLPGERITLYVFGDSSGFHPGWRFSSDFTQEQSISATAELISTQQMTFREFAAQSWDVTTGVTLSDWALTLATQIYRSSTYGYPHVSITSPTSHRWLQYDLTLEPGETVVNTVTLPLYPDVLFGGRQQRFKCHFDILSMRKPPVQNGPVITVNTPFEMTESSLEFTETDTGYTLDMTDIREIQLNVTLEESLPAASPSKAPANQPTEQVHWLTFLGGVALVFLGLYWFFRRKP